jgi:hypothetical protein
MASFSSQKERWQFMHSEAYHGCIQNPTAVTPGNISITTKDAIIGRRHKGKRAKQLPIPIARSPSLLRGRLLMRGLDRLRSRITAATHGRDRRRQASVHTTGCAALLHIGTTLPREPL